MKTAREFAKEILERHFTHAGTRDINELAELIEDREKELKAPGLIEHMRMLQDRNKFLQAETAKLQTKIAELKAPMKCGHPYACWTPGVVVYDSIDVLNREKTKMPYCAWCAEIAELKQAEVDAAIAASGELYEAGRKAGIAWAQAEIAELNTQHERILNQNVREIAELKAQVER